METICALARSSFNNSSSWSRDFYLAGPSLLHEGRLRQFGGAQTSVDLEHHHTAHSPYLQGRYHVPHLHSHEEIETLTSELESALLAAMKASEVLRAGFGAEHAITYKGEVDFVTEVDKEAERVIREELLGSFPTHGMLAEEGGELAGEGEARWIVDPLDGTTNYAHGLPIFCVSVALERAAEEVVLGVVHDPMRE